MKQTIAETLMKVFNLEPPPSDNVIDLLKKDHRKVEGLFKDFEKAESREDKLAILKEVITELNLHSAAEEKLVYSTLKDGEEDKVEEAFEEHHLAKFLLAELDQFDGTEENFDAKVKALSEVIKHHVKEEELDMLPKLNNSDNDLEELGREFLEEKEELRSNPPSLDLEKFSLNVSEEEEMEKQAPTVHARKVVQRGRKAKDARAAEPKIAATKKAGKTASSKKAATKSAAKKAGPGSIAKKTKSPKKATAKKAAPKKSATKGTATKKAAPKKSATKGIATKKATPKKSAAKGTATKKAAPRKSAAKGTATKKAAPKKSATKKTVAKKAAPKKSVAKKATSKKSAATKKTAPKKAAAKTATKPTAKRSSAGAKTKKTTTTKKAAVKKPAAKKKAASKSK